MSPGGTPLQTPPLRTPLSAPDPAKAAEKPRPGSALGLPPRTPQPPASLRHLLQWSTLEAALKRARRSPTDAVRKFLGQTIWHWDLARMPAYLRVGALALRLVYLVGRGFASSRAQLQAMALTYTTMLALVPVFAILVAVFSAPGLSEARGRLETFLIDALAASPDQGQVLSAQLSRLVENVRGSGGVAGVAFFVFLFLTVVALLNTLEKALNQIWNVKRERSLLNRFLTYWCIATLGPILLGLALVHGSSLETRLYDLQAWGEHELLGAIPSGSDEPPPPDAPRPEDEFSFGGVGGALAADLDTARRQQDGGEQTLELVLTGTRRASAREGGLSLPALGLTIVTFTLLFAGMPNTKVRLRPALAGAVLATLLWTLTKWGLAASSTTLVRYNTIYGSLATIPITMFWLYLTWLIVVLGAELTFAIQNIKTQRKEEMAGETSEVWSELVALRLAASIAKAFEHAETPPTTEQLAERLGAPHTLCSSLLFHLTEDGLLREIELDQDERGYVPARPIDRITVSDVVDSLRERRGMTFDMTWGDDMPVVSNYLGQANAASKALAGRITLRQVVAGFAPIASGPAATPVSPETAAVTVVAARALESAAAARGQGEGGSLLRRSGSGRQSVVRADAVAQAIAGVVPLRDAPPAAEAAAQGEPAATVAAAPAEAPAAPAPADAPVPVPVAAAAAAAAAAVAAAAATAQPS